MDKCGSLLLFFVYICPFGGIYIKKGLKMLFFFNRPTENKESEGEKNIEKKKTRREPITHRQIWSAFFARSRQCFPENKAANIDRLQQKWYVHNTSVPERNVPRVLLSHKNERGRNSRINQSRAKASTGSTRVKYGKGPRYDPLTGRPVN